MTKQREVMVEGNSLIRTLNTEEIANQCTKTNFLKEDVSVYGSPSKISEIRKKSGLTYS